MCSSFYYLFLFVAYGHLYTSQSVKQQIATTDDHIVISDGTEIRLYSRSSGKISSSLGIQSSTKITSIDYFQSLNESLEIVWIDSSGDFVNLDTVNLTSKTIIRRESKGHHLSNITSIAVLKSQPERVIVTTHDDGINSGRVVATNLDTHKDCLWVNDVKKPGQVVSGSPSNPFQVIWISDNNCAEGLLRNGTKYTIVCIADLRNISTEPFTLQSVSAIDGRFIILTSDGRLFHGGLSPKSFIEITHLNGMKIDRGFSNIDPIKSVDGIELFVSNKIDGSLIQVLLNDEFKFLKSNIVAVERSIFDFKVIQERNDHDYVVNCFSSKEENDIEEVIEIVEVLVMAGDETSEIVAGYPWLNLVCLVIMMSVTLMAALFYFHLRTRAHEPEALLNDRVSSSIEDPIVRVSGSNKCISIEDFGGFVNPSWSQVGNPCDSCDYKGECSERGMCLNTFRLLHDHNSQT